MHWITITCVAFSVLFMLGTFIVVVSNFLDADSLRSRFYAFVWAAAAAVTGLACGLGIGAATNEESANVYSAAWLACSLMLLIGSFLSPSDKSPSVLSNSATTARDWIDLHLDEATAATPKKRSQEIPKVTTLNFKTSGHVPRLKPDQNSTLRARGMTKLYSNWKAVYFEMGSPYGQAVMTEVYLVTEKDNAYDSHAIAVAYGEVKLGYIPASYAPQLGHLITVAGGVVRAEAELWFDFRTREKRNSIRLLVKLPFVLDS